MLPSPNKYQQWLLAIKENGDISVFKELYQHFWDVLYQYATKRIRDLQDVEDILQELFIQFWEKRHTLDTNMHLQAYLKGMLKYKIIDYYDSDRLKIRLLDHWSDHLYQFAQENPQELETYQWLEQELEKQVQALPQNMRQALLLKWEHKTIKDIAGQLGLSEQTVKNYLTEASNRLKAALNAHPNLKDQTR